MNKVILIVGCTGAGKSTYANKISDNSNTHILSNDEWFKTLYLKDLPKDSVYEWSLERTERIESVMLSEAKKLISKKLDVILDIGFFKKKQRSRVKNFFIQENILCEVHYLDVDKETRWSRVVERNTQKTGTFSFEVSKEDFEFCEEIYEPLDSEELKTAIVIGPEMDILSE